MENVQQLLIALAHNRVIMSAGCSWALAQIIKTIIYGIVNKEFRPERLVGSGGMPSCHSASVCGLAVSILITEGIGSPLFAIAAILAIIVMYDARGVRLETGKQAEALNEIIELLDKLGSPISNEQKFKEFIGHTPLQVGAGAILGICFACLYCFVIVPV